MKPDVEIFSGLHSCKPGNEPVVGQTKTFTIEHKPPRNGKKGWLKIKAAPPEKGGTPYCILSAEPTGYTDDFGNISFNLEIEPSTLGGTGDKPKSVREESVPSQNRVTNGEDGVRIAREHIQQSANLYLICVNAVEKYVAPNLPEAARTGEQCQAAVASLFIEASRRRSDDGVSYWSYVDKLPTKPIK